MYDTKYDDICVEKQRKCNSIEGAKHLLLENNVFFIVNGKEYKLSLDKDEQDSIKYYSMSWENNMTIRIVNKKSELEETVPYDPDFRFVLALGLNWGLEEASYFAFHEEDDNKMLGVRWVDGFVNAGLSVSNYFTLEQALEFDYATSTQLMRSCVIIRTEDDFVQTINGYSHVSGEYYEDSLSKANVGLVYAETSLYKSAYGFDAYTRHIGPVLVSTAFGYGKDLYLDVVKDPFEWDNFFDSQESGNVRRKDGHIHNEGFVLPNEAPLYIIVRRPISDDDMKVLLDYANKHSLEIKKLY